MHILGGSKLCNVQACRTCKGPLQKQDPPDIIKDEPTKKESFDNHISYKKDIPIRYNSANVQPGEPAFVNPNSLKPSQLFFVKLDNERVSAGMEVMIGNGCLWNVTDSHTRMSGTYAIMYCCANVAEYHSMVSRILNLLIIVASG